MWAGADYSTSRSKDWLSCGDSVPDMEELATHTFRMTLVNNTGGRVPDIIEELPR